jgi:hypothetical protein
LAQKTSWNGAPLTQTDINTYLMGEGGAWTSWTPTITQSFGVAINSGVLVARYGRWGRKIVFSAYITMAGNGATSNTIVVSLPVTASSGTYGLGTGGVVDVSTGLVYAGTSVAQTTTTAVLAWPVASAVPYLGAAGFTAALAVGDIVYISGTYEAAS